jgi:hypothetical protein
MFVEFIPGMFEVSFTGENIVAVTIWDNHAVVFVNVITNTITNTVDIGYLCYGTDFNMNRLAGILTRSINLPLGSKYTM